MNAPVQSVIIPAWNQKDMLMEAVASVLKQTQKDLEVIVIDDASTDGTSELIKTVTDERLHYFRNEKNMGGGRKRGLERARGKYITFLDHDDYYIDFDFFTKAIKILEEHENDPDPVLFVSANALRLDTRTNETLPSKIGPPGRVKGTDYILGNKYNKPFSVFPTVFRAEILRTAFEGRSTEDSLLYIQNAALGDAWFIPDIVGVWRVHGKNESFGIKNNPEYTARIFPAIKLMARHYSMIRDELYGKADRKTTDNWYVLRMTGMIWNNSSLPTLRDKLKCARIIVQESGSMPHLMLKMLAKTPYVLIRSFLSRITPLHRLYNVIKYGKYTGQTKN